MADSWPQEWERVRLGAVADLSWGDTKTTKASYASSGYRAFSASGPDGWLPYYDFNRTGVVVSAIGANCGTTYLAKGKWSCIKNTIRFWSNDTRADTEFLYWLTRGMDIWPRRGSAQPFISQGDARNITVALPPIEEQRAIASVLGALDDKIELNRRMNETLEALARAIFTSWFVTFDPVRARAEGRQPVGMDAETAALFPGSFEDSPLGPIPSGWRALPLDGVATFLNGLALQRYPPTGEGDLPVIKIPELRSGVTSTTGRASAEVPEQYVVGDGDVLFSWSGSLVTVLWSGGTGALNQHLFRVTSTAYPRWLYYFWIREHLQTFRQIAAGKATTMGHIQRGHLSQAMCVVPPEDVLRGTTATLEPMLEAMVTRGIESRSLAAIRDLLLPKLMSGELRGARKHSKEL